MFSMRVKIKELVFQSPFISLAYPVTCPAKKHDTTNGHSDK